jgi:two-component system response regulator MprA
LLRRSAQPAAGAEALPALERLVFQDLVLDLRTRDVTRDGRPLDLTRTEFLLLEYLMHHPGTALTRARIHRHV